MTALDNDDEALDTIARSEYTGAIILCREVQILKALRLACYAEAKSSLDQFREGLQAMVVLNIITKYPNLLRPFFVFEERYKFTSGNYM